MISPEKKETQEQLGEKREEADLKFEPSVPVSREIEILVSLIIQEKTCPNIQVYQEELVKSLAEKVNAQEASINEIPKESQDNKLFVDLYKQELEKIKFLMKMYFRTRLQKANFFSFRLKNIQISSKKKTSATSFPLPNKNSPNVSIRSGQIISKKSSFQRFLAV